MAIIGKGGSAPEHYKNGYRGEGRTIHGTEAEVLAEYEGQDVVLVAGALVSGTVDAYEFYPMKQADSLTRCATSNIQN